VESPRRSKTTATPDGFFTPAPPRVLAHRGLAIDAPENTLLAFARAIAAGVTHVETDVHVSADGVAMVSHDPDLRRLTDRNAAVADLTSHELRRIDLGFGQGYCTLAEALDAFPDTRFNIDMKIEGAVVPAVDAIRTANATRRVLIGSFSAARRLKAVRMLPGVATSVSARGGIAAVAAAQRGPSAALRRILRDVDAVQLPPTVLGMRTFTARTIEGFHDAGVEVHAWTINAPLEMDRLLAIGVDGLVSDRADLALEAIRRRS
jgi:glycerophosphoryl diester phosphodiesterase